MKDCEIPRIIGSIVPWLRIVIDLARLGIHESDSKLGRFRNQGYLVKVIAAQYLESRIRLHWSE